MAAIYIPPWPLAEQFTTTLYPVDVQDSMVISATVLGGSMDTIPEDLLDHSHSMGVSTYIQKRWFFEDGPYEDELDHGHSLPIGTYIQKRWFYEDGPYEDELDHGHSIAGASYENKLIYGDTPDEKLQLALVINNTSTMDAI